MATLKGIFYGLAGFGLASVLSCQGGHSNADSQLNNYKSVRITINSPYSCYSEIQLEQTGSGVRIFGYRDRQTGKTDIAIRKTFLIHTECVKMKVDSLVANIHRRKPVYSNRGLDLYQFELEIDGKKYVDKYGVDSLVNSILFLLLPYVQVNSKAEQCDYFYYFKQMQSPNPIAR